MKNLLFACASLALISSANAAGEGVDHKVNGEVRVRYYNTDNEQFKDTGADTKWFQRTKLGYTLMKGDDLTFHAGMLTARRWGNDTADSSDVTAPGKDDGNNGVLLHEAHVTWKAMDNMAVKIGRGAVDIGDGRVVSKNEWFQVPFSFDGVAAMYFAEMANVTAFGVRATDSNTDTFYTSVYADTANNNTETNFYGLSVDFKNLPEVLKMVNIHLLQENTYNISGVAAGLGANYADSNATKLRYGLAVSGGVSGVDYRLTYAGYTGEVESNSAAASPGSIDTDGWMLDLEAGYTLADVMGLRIHGLYHQDTGDKDGAADTADGELETYSSFYYDQHNNAGMMDLVNWGNLTYWKLGVSLNPAEMVTVGLDYYDFSVTEKRDAAASANAAKSLNNGKTVDVNEEDIGQEIDLYATKTLSNGTEFMLRYSTFMAEKSSFDAADTVSEDNITQIFAQAKFSF